MSRDSHNKGKTKSNYGPLRALSEKMLGNKSALGCVRSAAYRQRKSEDRRRWLLTDDGIKYREKMSKVAVRRIRAGWNPQGRSSRGYFYSIKNGVFLFYRSSYELTAYQLLEQLGKVSAYSREPFDVQYRYRGVVKNTVPDILVTYDDGFQELIEVKPSTKLEKMEPERVKVEAIRQYALGNGLGFQVWSENELGLSKNSCQKHL